MRITINDIARISGFSKTSVSFAFNDPDRISKETREKILGIASELGYVPDPVARNLSRRKIGTIGLLLPQAISRALLNPYLAQVLLGIGEVCHTEEYSLTLVPPLRGDMDAGVRTAAVDGFITLGLQPEMKVVQLIRARHVPFVTIDGRQDDEIPSVNTNDRQAADVCMNHILELGHRRICIVSLEEPRDIGDQPISGVCEWRAAGYADALARHGLQTSPDIQNRRAEASQESGRQAVASIFDGDSKQWPTALVCMSDISAIGAMLALRERGIAVPQQVSVIGFDDIPESAIINPGLTTASQPGQEKGASAATMLFEILQKKPSVTHINFPANLVIRQSTAAPV